MKYEVVWFEGDFCYTEVVGNINQAFMLAKKKLSEKDVDEIEIVKVKELK